MAAEGKIAHFADQFAAAQKRHEALLGDRGLYGKLERARSNIAARLPAGVNVDRWIAALHTEIQKTPKLLRCDPATVLGGAYEVAHLGLHLGSALGHAYLIPYGNKAQLVIGYKGMIALALASGGVESVDAAVVFEADDFEFEQGSERRLSHRPTMKRDRGDRVCVYSVIYLRGGGRHVVVIPWWEIEDLAATLGKRGGPWVTHRDEMAKKTAIRRALKYARLSPEAASGVHLDDLAESGIGQGLESRGRLVIEQIEAHEAEAEAPAAIEAEPVDASEAEDADPFDPAYFAGGEG